MLSLKNIRSLPISTNILILYLYETRPRIQYSQIPHYINKVEFISEFNIKALGLI